MRQSRTCLSSMAGCHVFLQQPLSASGAIRARMISPSTTGIRRTLRLACNARITSVTPLPPHRSRPCDRPSAPIHTAPRLSVSAQRTNAANIDSSLASPTSEDEHIETVVLDGKATADAICDDIQHLVRHYQSTLHADDRPGLTVIIAGDRRDSLRYVQRKTEQADRLGFQSRLIRFPQSVTTAQLLSAIEGLNGDSTVHGVLVQLPLPEHVEQDRVLEAVCIEKDVDGFHPYNMGLLALNWKGAGQFVPWEKVHRTIEVGGSGTRSSVVALV